MSDITLEQLDEIDDFQPLPTPQRRAAPDAEYRQWLDKVLTPQLRAALAAGNRVTLLKRDEDKNDNKMPLVKGFLDASTNRWDFADLQGQAKWAIENGITLTGYGYIGGAMSGNRLTLDIDRGDYLDRIVAKVQERTGIDLMQFPRVRSGREGAPGYHVHLRTTEPMASSVIARLMIDGKPVVLAEAKATGYQVVGPGCRHKSGRLYETEHGDPHAPPVIPVADAQAIVDAIRTFDQTPPKPSRPAPAPRPRIEREYKPGTSGKDIADRYNAETSIEEALISYGYASGSGDFYIHPNNDSGQSVHLVGDNLAHHFGANDPMGTGETSSPFALYAHFEHGGDFGAAVKALAKRYGVEHQPQKIDPADCVWESDADKWLLAAFAVTEETPQAITTQPKNYLVLENMDEVSAKNIDWIWPGRLARGKLTLVCGDPGKGKSFLSLDIAARVSTGAPFPDGHTSRIGTTLIITDEDDSADTIKPRLIAMGADPRKIKRLRAMHIEGKDKGWTLKAVAALADAIRQYPDLQLVIIDPLMSYFGGAKSADPAEVNALLGGLNDFAADYGVAVMALVHLNKDSKSGNALYRSMGSISVVGKARLAFLVAPDTTDPDLRVMAQTKANAAAPAPALAYRIVPVTVTEGGNEIATARVLWQEGTVDITADDLLGGGEQTGRQGAEDFLREYLTKEMRSDDVKAEAQRRGISSSTLFRARKEMGIKARKGGIKDGWLWSPVVTTKDQERGTDSWGDC